MGDLIDRQVIIEKMRNRKRLFCKNEIGFMVLSKDEKARVDEIDNCIANLLNAPSAEPERKMGRWERHNTYHGDDVSGFIDPDWRCSKCGEQANVNAWCMYDLTDFCPNCGADMRGEKNGE